MGWSKTRIESTLKPLRRPNYKNVCEKKTIQRQVFLLNELQDVLKRVDTYE